MTASASEIDHETLSVIRGDTYEIEDDESGEQDDREDEGNDTTEIFDIEAISDDSNSLDSTDDGNVEDKDSTSEQPVWIVDESIADIELNADDTSLADSTDEDFNNDDSISKEAFLTLDTSIAIDPVYTPAIAHNLIESGEISSGDDNSGTDGDSYPVATDLNADGWNDDWIKRTDLADQESNDETHDTGTNHGHIEGGNDDDSLDDGVGSNIVTCGLGDDHIDGDDGDDRYLGGSGDDTVGYSMAKAGVRVNLMKGRADSLNRDHDAGIGSDRLKSIENVTGSDFDDTLIGNGQTNRLEGGNGDDLLLGGRGADILAGGADRDTFTFNKPRDTGLDGKSDLIEDFVSGEDRIDLSAIDAQRGHSRNDAFTLLDDAPTDGTSANGALWFDSESETLYGSTDTDLAAEFAINVTGVNTLTAGDLIL